MATFAKTFNIDISTARPSVSNEAYYHGETIVFEVTRNGAAVTNIEFSCVYYQTNGMGQAWWKTDALVFHPTNDVGAAAYRFFLEGRDDIGRDWHANGLLRLLDSPGFEPNALELPVATLDFAGLEILNAPWPDEADIADAANAVAQAARAYTDDAISGIDVTETDPVWSAEKSQYATTDALDASQRVVLALTQGTNVLAVVTNYNSQVNLPEFSLKYLDGDNGYIEVWREGRRIEAATNALHQIEQDALDAGLATKADAAWSRTTSGLGQEAPSNTTWISTATTVIAGGYEYAKTVTSNGAVWFLASNGMDLGFAQGSTNAFLSISAADGTPIFSIEKTDSYLVGVDPSNILTVGTACIVSLPVVATTHPYARVATNLVNAVWSKEDEHGMPALSPATVSWSGTSGAYVATVDFGTSPQGFCYFEYLQEGMTKIINAGATDLSGGIYYDGHLYTPTVSSTQLIFQRSRND